MDNTRFTVCAFILLGLITEVILIPFSIPGACSPKRITCQCGLSDGYNVDIYIEQCSSFYRWRLTCGDCKDEPDNDSRCSVFRNCLDCDNTRDQCSTCPVGRYGKRCTAECKCPQGVTCNQNNGQCICANGVCQDPQTVCPIPHFVENGAFIPVSESYQKGSSVTYNCKPGFKIQGPSTIYCIDNGQWVGQIPTCVSALCPPTSAPTNGVVEHDFQNGIASYRCNAGYKLIGDAKRTCGTNLVWLGSTPKCVITCPALENLTNGYVYIVMLEPESENGFKVANMLSDVSSRAFVGVKFRSTLPTLSPQERAAGLSVKLPKGDYHVGTRASFTCKSPYYDLIGSKVRSCLTTGQWSGRQPSCIAVCGRSSAPLNPFIAGGTVSTAGQWPWQVGISRRLAENHPSGDWLLTCGASLINEHWVVTAAHCVTRSNVVLPNEFKLSFGKYYRNDSQDDSEVQVRSIEEIHVHPGYDPRSLDSDIALIKISHAVNFTSTVQPVCLPNGKADDSDFRLEVGNEGTVIGWGRTEDGSLSNVLRHTKVPVISSAQCQKDYTDQKINAVVSANMICAGFVRGGSNSCNGDSGGPLVFPKDSRENKWVLEGIVSWGSPFGCEKEKQYGAYTRVQRFVEWMEDFI